MQLLNTTPDSSATPIVFGIFAFLLFLFVILLMIFKIHRQSEADYDNITHNDPMLDKWVENEKTDY